MRLKMISFALAGILLSPIAHAQGYPDHTITIIQPVAVGSSVDPLLHLIGNGITERLGQPVVVEFTSGAGGAIGSNQVAKAKPDGYTLLSANAGPISILPNLKTNLQYNAGKDFRAVAPLFSFPYVLMVSPNSTIKSLANLIDYAKKNPGKLSFGTSGVGEPAHLAAEMLKLAAGIDVKIVHYRGTTPAMLDLLGNHIDALFTNIAAAVPVIKQAHALAVTGQQRNPSVPDVPTMVESGYKDFLVVSWVGILAPAKTPDAVVAKLEETIGKIMDTKAAQDLLTPLGNTRMSGTASEFDAFIAHEREKWGAVIKEAHVPMQD